MYFSKSLILDIELNHSLLLPQSLQLTERVVSDQGGHLHGFKALTQNISYILQKGCFVYVRS